MAHAIPLQLPATAAGRLLFATPVLKPLSVDMAKGRLTVLMPPDMVLRAGMRFGFVDESDARAALEADAYVEARRASSFEMLPESEEASVRFFTIDGDQAITVTRGHYESVVYHERTPNEKGRGGSRWYGSISRTDSSGRSWRYHISCMVIDDFGDLVEVKRS